jgi:hypothetical protein
VGSLYPRRAEVPNSGPERSIVVVQIAGKLSYTLPYEGTGQHVAAINGEKLSGSSFSESFEGLTIESTYVYWK